MFKEFWVEFAIYFTLNSIIIIIIIIIIFYFCQQPFLSYRFCRRIMLNFSDMTSEFCIIAMFIFVNLRTAFFLYCVNMFVIHFTGAICLTQMVYWLSQSNQNAETIWARPCLIILISTQILPKETSEADQGLGYNCR
jgi:hypothetical protein